MLSKCTVPGFSAEENIHLPNCSVNVHALLMHAKCVCDQHTWAQPTDWAVHDSNHDSIPRFYQKPSPRTVQLLTVLRSGGDKNTFRRRVTFVSAVLTTEKRVSVKMTIQKECVKSLSNISQLVDFLFIPPLVSPSGCCLEH